MAQNKPFEEKQAIQSCRFVRGARADFSGFKTPVLSA